MKKIMSRTIAVSMAAMMAIGLSACGNNTESTADVTTEEMTGMVNPVSEVTEQEMIEKTSIDLPAPEGATNVSYLVIDDGDTQIAEMDYTLNGKGYFLRACPVGVTEITPASEESDPSEEQENDYGTGFISGLYYDWTTTGEADVQYLTGYYYVSDEGAGYMAWLDVVPGILYNLGMKTDATAEDLINEANNVFVPMQTESDGDDEMAVADEFKTLLQTISDTKAGSAGSSGRVAAAAEDLKKFVEDYSTEISAQNMEALSAEYLGEMNAANENFKDHFKECFDAVVEEVKLNDESIETDVAFNQVVNGISSALENL